MWSVKTAGGVRGGGNPVTHFLSRYFPTPELLSPRSAGIDISDSSVKWIVIAPRKKIKTVVSYGSEIIPEGVLEKGEIRDAPALAKILKQVKKKMGGVACAHAALPEEAAYVFSMHVPEDTARKQVLSMIEFELENRVPLSPQDAVYDFSVIMKRDDGVGEEIGVAVFPIELARSYANVFKDAGIELLSLELEASSIARAISSRPLDLVHGKREDEPIILYVDFGRARTGFAVLKRGIPIFTSTVEVGGDAITRALTEKLHMTPEDAAHFKNEQALNATKETPPAFEAISGTPSALANGETRPIHKRDPRLNDRGERMT